MFLSKPSILYKDSFLKAYAQIIAEGNQPFLQTEIDPDNFQKYCDTLIGYERGIGLPEGFLGGTTFWLIDNDEYIGRVSVRHSLNEDLLQYGGHIGYIIAPEQRKKGYGSQILKLALAEAVKLGLNKVLVTCDKDNVASAKIIEKNGGVFENETYQDEKKVYKKRYWISLNG